MSARIQAHTISDGSFEFRILSQPQNLEFCNIPENFHVLQSYILQQSQDHKP